MRDEKPRQAFAAPCQTPEVLLPHRGKVGGVAADAFARRKIARKPRQPIVSLSEIREDEAANLANFG